MAYKAAKAYYRVKTIPSEGTQAAKPNVTITKFTPDLEVESSYTMSFIPSQGAEGGYYDCNCPASKFDCRHKSILKQFEAYGQIDGEKFFCFETKTFHEMNEVK